MLNDCYKDSFRNPFGQRPWLENVSAASHASNQAIKGVFAGGAAGVLECFITYPIDYIKTKLQLDVSQKYKGVYDCFNQTIKPKGLLALYKGLNVLCLGSLPRAAIRFGTFETIRSLLADKDQHLDRKSKILCGLSAGLAESLLFGIPIETINIKIINNKEQHNSDIGFAKTVRTIIKNEGISGIYQGVTPTLMKQSFSQIVRFYLLETAKELYVKHDKTVISAHGIPKHLLVIMGTLGGLIPVLINNPIDVVKTRMQSDKSFKYKNMYDCMRQIWELEGYKGFYRGTCARLLHVCAGVSITFVLYETIMEYLDEIFPP